MKKQIRNSVFETNSSSTHSITFKKRGGLEPSNLIVYRNDNKVHTRFGEFGWEIKNYNLQQDKLSYLVTMLFETIRRKINHPVDPYEYIKNTDGFKKIEDTIKEYCNCDGLEIDDEISLDYYTYGNDIRYYISSEGYIDHQSCENYGSIDDFLNHYGVDNVRDFIFDSSVIVHTDNDNH